MQRQPSAVKNEKGNKYIYDAIDEIFFLLKKKKRKMIQAELLGINNTRDGIDSKLDTMGKKESELKHSNRNYAKWNAQENKNFKI